MYTEPVLVRLRTVHPEAAFGAPSSAPLPSAPSFKVLPKWVLRQASVTIAGRKTAFSGHCALSVHLVSWRPWPGNFHARATRVSAGNCSAQKCRFCD
jgi:hypothetical protein